MQVTAKGLGDIKLSEGFSSKPYWDRYGKVWTIGYGETDGITANTKPITRAEGERRLIARFEKDYAWALKPFVDLDGFNQNRYDALASFIWNCGVGSVGRGTGVGDALRRRDWSGATSVMLKWNKANGEFMQGLYDRRVREIKLFNTPVKSTRKLKFNADEKRELENLRSKRRTAHRNKGWDNVDASHKISAEKSRLWLRRRASEILANKSVKDKSYQKRKAAALKAVADNPNDRG